VRDEGDKEPYANPQSMRRYRRYAPREMPPCVCRMSGITRVDRRAPRLPSKCQFRTVTWIDQTGVRYQFRRARGAVGCRREMAVYQSNAFSDISCLSLCRGAHDQPLLAPTNDPHLTMVSLPSPVRLRVIDRRAADRIKSLMPS